MAAARACGKAVENAGARTETQDVFANPDGSWVAKVYTSPVRMRDAAGAWTPIDLTMRAGADGQVAPVAHPGNLRLSGAAGKGEHELLSVDAGSGRISMGWNGVLPAPVLSGNKATYPEVRPGVDLVVTATRRGAEQFLLVKDRAAAARVSTVDLPLRAKGLQMADDGSGGTVFRDAKNKVVATSPTPEMWDSSVPPDSGQPRRAHPIPAKRQNGTSSSAKLRLSPSTSFLDDPATVYPVTIDPSINPLNDSFDTYVKQNDTVDRSDSDTLALGWDTEYQGIARSFLNWNVSALKGKKVTSSTVYFYNWYSATCSARGWDLWSTGAASSATRWTNQPSWLTKEASSTQTKGFSSSCNDGWVTISGTSFFDRAAAAQQSTAYMGLRASSEAQDVTYWKNFRSARTDNADHIPYAVVNYNSYPNALDPLKLQPGDAAETGTRTPTMKGVFSDPDGGTGRVDYEVYDRTGATLKTSGSGGTVSNGSESNWDVPSGKLDANTTYKWRARGYDGSLYGPWSQWRFMTTSDGSPTGEQGRFSFQDQDLSDKLKLKVNVANGNLLLETTDLQIRGTGIDLELGRYYNSRSTVVSSLGKGWSLGSAQDVKLSFSKSDHATADVTYYAPTGFTAKFVNDGSNSWRTPPSLDAKLTRDTDTGELRLKFDKSEGSFYFADSTGRLLRNQDKNKNKITYAYNSAGQVSKITDTQAREVSLAYVGDRLDSVTDSTGRSIRYTYNAAKDLEAVTDPENGVSRFEYTNDRLSRITTPGGRVTNLGYEPETSRMLDYFEQVNPAGTPAQAKYSFDYSAGQTKVTDPNGNVTADTSDGITTHKYESRDRVNEVTDALDHKRSKKYNANDNVESSTDALTNTTTFGYDPNTNNMTSAGIATGAKSKLDYGNSSHPHSVSGETDPQGNTLSYSYDSAGNKTGTESSQYPGQKIDDADYNDDGTVNWREDGKDVRTNYEYDSKGNLTKVNNPSPLGDITITPDPLSRMGDRTDGKNQKTVYEYDKLDRVKKITYADYKTVQYTYDPDGNLTRIVDPSGTTVLTYDGFGRPSGKTAPNTAPISYGYDNNGNLTAFTDGGGTVTYTYDQVNLLKTLQEPGAPKPVRFSYDENNRRRFVYLPTNPQVTVEMKYDKSGRQTSIVATNDSKAAKLTSYVYDYSKDGGDTALRQSVADLSGTTSYSYDKLNRLTKASGPGSFSRSYNYDANYNRTSKTENGTDTDYTYDDAHELTKAGSTTYSYDGNGNATSSSSGWDFDYNTLDQTTSITKPGGTALTPLTYGGADQTERRSAGTTTYGTSALGVSSASAAGGPGGPVGDNTVDPAPGTSQQYTRDNTGGLISLRSNGARYYYLVDGLGSVVGLVNDSATKVNSYSYDPYGVQLSAGQQIANPWRFASGYFDGSTGLTKFGARYYSADLGRFNQRDPSGKDLPYTYAGCDPVNHTDPTGLSWKCKTAEYGARVLGTAIGGAFGFGVGTLVGGPAGAGVGAAVGGIGLGGLAGGYVDTACSAQEDNKPFTFGDFSANVFFGWIP
ncbi:hypothetical protein Asi03nite_45000 [Actinoplanes siamensis]|uniref:RHS repeat-associated protein n=1 Tax=Actinoplanes siamensis TaxID=1223317 RepID=A0A919N9V7_9ACTN|nr:hypothetical protein Asi03nite_45000 [Actinoplanes siamensis]